MGRDGKTKLSNDELTEAIDILSKECADNDDPFTLSILAERIGVCIDTITDWGKRPELSEQIKRAKTIAMNSLVRGGLTNKLNPTMSIFLLKVNHGMQDKQVIESDGTLQVNFYKDKDGSS